MAPPYLRKNSLVIFKAQADPAVAITLDKVTDAKLLSYDVTYEHTAGFYSRNVAALTFSEPTQRLNSALATITFKTDAYASGTATIAPYWAGLFSGCGLTQSIGANYVVWYPTTFPTFTGSATDGSSIFTMAVFEDGVRKVMRSAVGNVRISGTTGGVVVCDWTFNGAHYDHFTDSYPNLTVDATRNMGILMELGTFTVGGYANFVVRGFTFDLGNIIAQRTHINNTSIDGQGEFCIVDSAPTLSVDVEQASPSSFNALGYLQSNTLFDISLVIGQTLGKRLSFYSNYGGTAKAQIISITESEQDNIIMNTLTFKFVQVLKEAQHSFYIQQN